MKRLSILVALYHEDLETISKTISSMKQLQYPDKEVLIIFDLEEAALAKVVEAEGFKAIITDGKEKGKAYQLNAGFKASTGDVIGFYDADTEPEPKQALKAVQALEEGYDAVIGYVVSPTDTWLQRMRAIDLLEYCSSVHTQAIPTMMGYSLYIKRNTIANAGGWDTDTVTEDFDFSVKAALKGWKIGVINSPVYAESSKGFKNILMQRCRWIKGGFQVTTKKRDLSGLPFKKRVLFTLFRATYYLSLLTIPLVLLSFYCVFSLLLGNRDAYLWILPSLHLFYYLIAVFMLTKRQLVKLEGVSFLDYLVFPVYRCLFCGAAAWIAFIDWKRRPLYWYRTER